MENNNINLVMAINEKFIMPTRVTIASIKENKQDEIINIYILHFNISNEGVSLLESDSTDSVRIKCLKIDEKEIPDVKMFYEFSKEIMVKLFIYKFLPLNIEKVIWIDSDIIVLKSFKELNDIDVSDYYYGAYIDQNVKPKDLKRIELPLDFNYINVGIMPINLKNIRNDKSYEKDIVDYCNNVTYDLEFPEQDIINKLYCTCNKVKVLGSPFKYNRFVDKIHTNEIEKDDIAVLHYQGYHQKPWKGKACRHYHLWWKYARTIKEYRKEYWKILPIYIRNFIKKIFVKIGLILGIKKKHKH